MYCSLVEGIELYRRALVNGREIFVFPPDFNPWDSQDFNSTVEQKAALTKIIPLSSRIKAQGAASFRN